MTKYSNLNYFMRVRGLCSVLTAKLSQNDLKIVKDLDSFDSDDPKDLVDALEERRWGPSCLFVDTADIFPKNLALASHPIDHVNLMPLYGLNVHSMLKHETLVLTMNALNELENKLLFAFNRTDIRNVMKKHEPPRIIPEETPEFEGARWVTNLHSSDWI